MSMLYAARTSDRPLVGLGQEHRCFGNPQDLATCALVDVASGTVYHEHLECARQAGAAQEGR
jgi:hypothetical protein